MLTSSPTASADRIRRLEDYFHASILSSAGDFVCASGQACEASAVRRKDAGFYPAQGSAVGPHYDMSEAGTPLRVLVVPMETGRARSKVSIEERTDEVLVRVGQPWRSMNPHMRGVALALRLAFGTYSDDEHDLWLETSDGRCHVFEAYAMHNLLLCSAVKIGTARSMSTPTMRMNCLPHLDATVEILRPTLVISQGATVSGPLRGLFTVETQHSPNLATCSVDGVRFIWANLYHPARWWDSPRKPYFVDVVEPTLTEARRRALKLAGFAR